MTPEPMYIYRATALSITDGDSFIADVDLGMRTHKHAKIRLVRLDTPEKREDAEGWLLGRDRLAGMIFGRTLILQTYRDRTTFDRWLAEVWVPAEFNVSDEMRKRYGYPEWVP